MNPVVHGDILLTAVHRQAKTPLPIFGLDGEVFMIKLNKETNDSIVKRVFFLLIITITVFIVFIALPG